MTAEAQLDRLLEYLFQSRGVDFRGYKRSGVMRRVVKRMGVVGLREMSAYQDLLEADAQEYHQLFNTLLINVTSFFRDGAVWDQLRDTCAASLAVPRPSGVSYRVWTAGCATGQEAYSIAMMMAEVMGLEEFCRTTKVYATDIDDEALGRARQGTYSAREVASVPAPLLERYFERVGPHFVIHKELRRRVIFGHHNVIQDAPISRIDLLTCRNTLMYFDTDTQSKILSRFHFALNPEGILFLGKAEMLLMHGDLFHPVDLKRRLFTKSPRPVPRERALRPAPQGDETSVGSLRYLLLRGLTFECSPLAQLVLDPAQHLVLCNERSRLLFDVASHDIGRPFQELKLAVRDELRTAVQQAISERRTVVIAVFEWPIAGAHHQFEVRAVPLVEEGGVLLGVMISLQDVSPQQRALHELQQVKRELLQAYEGLQSTSEELETTNEELQSTVEELETTNEELQSTNEELETMNEELQSTNEELQNTNEEVRQGGEDLNQANLFLQSILTSLRVGVVVLDHELLIRIWNHRAEDLWGLRSEEVQGKHLLNLDIGLPVNQLHSMLRASATGDREHQEITLEAINRRGKNIQCKVTCTSLPPFEQAERGSILLMEEIYP